jgi:polar amino acid transport system substrate-binding protein/glutamate/aspartate transport system substrate-binding protein
MRLSLRFAAALSLAAMTCAGAASAAGTLDRIRESGEIRLGYRLDAAPLSFADAEGLPAGYSVKVCEGVAARLQAALGLAELRREWVTVTTEDRFDAVSEGRIDLLCEAATVTLTRREQVDFSIPTFIDGAAVLLRKGSEPTFEALAGKRIGVHDATTTEDMLRKSLEEQGITAEIVETGSHQDGLAGLLAGEIDAYFGDQSVLIGLLLSSPERETLALSDNTLSVEKHALALARGDTDFRLAVDRAISALYTEGEMIRAFEAALPGIEPGIAIRALFLIAPELP